MSKVQSGCSNRQSKAVHLQPHTSAVLSHSEPGPFTESTSLLLLLLLLDAGPASVLPPIPSETLNYFLEVMKL